MALDDEAKALCVISLPWGLYQYNVLPQGVNVAVISGNDYSCCLYG
jgi:hypothetical protein